MNRSLYVIQTDLAGRFEIRCRAYNMETTTDETSAAKESINSLKTEKNLNDQIRETPAKSDGPGPDLVDQPAVEVAALHAPIKRGRGRPRKNAVAEHSQPKLVDKKPIEKPEKADEKPDEPAEKPEDPIEKPKVFFEKAEVPIKRGRGRPKKNSVMEKYEPKLAEEPYEKPDSPIEEIPTENPDTLKEIAEEPYEMAEEPIEEAGAPIEKAEVPFKRGRGRPRKNQSQPKLADKNSEVPTENPIKKSKVSSKNPKVPIKRGRGRPRKIQPEPKLANEEEENGDEGPSVARPKRKTIGVVSKIEGKRGKMEAYNHSPPLKKFVGAHVSIAGGVDNAVENAVAIEAKAFALFLHSQRQWATKPLAEESIDNFRKACKQHDYPPHLILPHGSYLINLGAPNPEILEKSRVLFLEEFKKCEQLGLTLLNFHPGSTCGKITIEECLDKIADSINYVLSKTTKVTAVIENMSCQGHTVGGKFEEIRDIINRVTDKSRVGVCLDTCHAFAAGYDISKSEGYEKMMDDFTHIIGLQYLRGVHLNDSKDKVGCHKDRHENIGEGHIGLDTFELIMNDPRFNNIPLILETPIDISDEDEIATLYSFIE